MGVINLAHGSFYMIGAYLAFSLTEATGNLWLAIAARRARSRWLLGSCSNGCCSGTSTGATTCTRCC